MKYGNRSLWRTFISSPISLVVLAIVLFIVARAALNINEKVDTSAAKLAQAEAEYQRLLERQQDLSRRVGYLSTDQGLEAEIRTKYHAVKEGEQVAVMVDGTQAASALQAASGTQATSTPGFWQRLLHRLGL